MPFSFLLARTTIAIAFQRTRLLMRRSRARSPGNGCCRFRRDGVDVRRVSREGHLHAGADRLVFEAREQVAGAVGAVVLQDAGQRVEPFARLGRRPASPLGVPLPFCDVTPSAAMKELRARPWAGQVRLVYSYMGGAAAAKGIPSLKRQRRAFAGLQCLDALAWRRSHGRRWPIARSGSPAASAHRLRQLPVGLEVRQK